MGKNRRRQKHRAHSRDISQDNGNDGRGKAYQDIVKVNADFEVYYKAQNIIPENEWDQFMETLREGLPVSFRIAGYRGQAKALLKIIQSQYFHDLLKVHLEGVTVEKPLCIPWYPDSLAWQLKLSRVTIRKSEEFERLHNFLISETESGNISRQETVSMLPPLLLDIQPHHKVLDMCAAPGSKTAQIIEMLHKDEGKIPEGVVVANDVDNKRCYMLVHQAKRMQSPCFIITNHDASQMPNLIVNEDGKESILKYDRILCDVPCSGDGTIRKNVDIWTKWNIANGNNMYGLQLRIARRGLELLACGGRMIYSTCSLNPLEDEAVIASLLQQCEGRVELIDVSGQLTGLKACPGLSHWVVMSREKDVFSTWDGVPQRYVTQIRPGMFPLPKDEAHKLNLHRCRRILPHHQDTGGFFLAVLQKNTHSLPWEASEELADNKGSASNAGTNGPATENSSSRIVPPPRKKQKIFGYKEDPYIFLNEDSEILKEIQTFFRLTEEFPCTHLLSRCLTGKKRNLYFVSKAAKSIVKLNAKSVKIINTGVRLFCRCENRDAKCSFRIAHEGVPTILPFMEGRILHLLPEDLASLLVQENPSCASLSSTLQIQLKNTESGCVVMSCMINQGTEEEFRIVVCGWKGNTSLKCYVPKNEQIHYLRMCGADTSAFERKEKSKSGKTKPGDRQLTVPSDAMNDGELNETVSANNESTS